MESGKNVLHIRVSGAMKRQMEHLVDLGLFSNKNEVVRKSIRDVLQKYKEEVGK